MRGAPLFVAIVAGLTICVGTAVAGGPGGRHYRGAHFSAGVAAASQQGQGGRPGQHGHQGGGGGNSQQGELVRVSDDAASASPVIPPDPFGGFLYLNSEVEPSLAVSASDRRRQVGFYQEDRWDNGGSRSLVFATTRDGGQTWVDQPVPGISLTFGGTYERITDPWVAFGPGNRVYGFSLAFDQNTPRNALFVNTSRDGGLTWGPPVPVQVDTDIAFFNDKNAIAADDFAGSRNRGNVYTAWDRLASLDPTGTHFTGPALFSRSVDGGAHFSTPIELFHTGVDEQTIGNVPVVLPDGTVVVGGTFIDAVNNFFFWVARSSDGGATFSPPQIVDTEQVFVIPDIRDGSLVPSFAVDRRTGRLYATWEDSRFSGGVRMDVLVTWSDDAGRTWSTPVRANDTPRNAQSPIAPAIQVDDQGRVGVLYYDLRGDAAPGDAQFLTTEWFALSTDRGRHFHESERVTPTFDQANAPNAGGFFLGDYQALGSVGDGFQAFFAAALLPQADGLIGTDIFSARVP
jgi:hypothetical protein